LTILKTTEINKQRIMYTLHILITFNLFTVRHGYKRWTEKLYYGYDKAILELPFDITETPIKEAERF